MSASGETIYTLRNRKTGHEYQETEDGIAKLKQRGAINNYSIVSEQTVPSNPIHVSFGPATTEGRQGLIAEELAIGGDSQNESDTDSGFQEGEVTTNDDEQE